eukprot:g29643.t1
MITLFRSSALEQLSRRSAESKPFCWQDLEANGRGRKRLAHELEATSRPLTALELLCQQLPPPEPKPRKREDKVPRQLQEEVKDEVEKVKTAWKLGSIQEKTEEEGQGHERSGESAVQVLEGDRELLEKATGPIVEGYIDEAFTAWLAFERAEDAEGLYNDFNGGEISGESIEVQLLSDSEPLGRA